MEQLGANQSSSMRIEQKMCNPTVLDSFDLGWADQVKVLGLSTNSIGLGCVAQDFNPNPSQNWAAFHFPTKTKPELPIPGFELSTIYHAPLLFSM